MLAEVASGFKRKRQVSGGSSQSAAIAGAGVSTVVHESGAMRTKKYRSSLFEARLWRFDPEIPNKYSFKAHNSSHAYSLCCHFNKFLVDNKILGSKAYTEKDELDKDLVVVEGNLQALAYAHGVDLDIFDVKNIKPRGQEKRLRRASGADVVVPPSPSLVSPALRLIIPVSTADDPLIVVNPPSRAHLAAMSAAPRAGPLPSPSETLFHSSHAVGGVSSSESTVASSPSVYLKDATPFAAASFVDTVTGVVLTRVAARD